MQLPDNIPPHLRYDVVEEAGETYMRVPAEFEDYSDSNADVCNRCAFRSTECPHDEFGNNACVNEYPSWLGGRSRGIIYIKPTNESVEKYLVAVALAKLEGS